MKQTINLFDFRRAFKDHDLDNFTYEGLNLLFEHLEGFERDTGEEFELDVIALCCEFSEMPLSELLESYDITDEKLTDDNEAELLGLATNYLSDNTLLCGVTENNNFVFQEF
jgi:hypothetical protein